MTNPSGPTKRGVIISTTRRSDTGSYLVSLKYKALEHKYMRRAKKNTSTPRSAANQVLEADPKYPKRSSQPSFTETNIWVWLKITQEGLPRFWFMFPFPRVPFWYRLFEPQSYPSGLAIQLERALAVSCSKLRPKRSQGGQCLIRDQRIHQKTPGRFSSNSWQRWSLIPKRIL